MAPLCGMWRVERCPPQRSRRRSSAPCRYTVSLSPLAMITAEADGIGCTPGDLLASRCSFLRGKIHWSAHGFWALCSIWAWLSTTTTTLSCLYSNTMFLICDLCCTGF
uniref:Uncharacterized protein n=1 Tax=Arundo donax TaxID=35708 RepID=A0A0A8ZVC0_ARUDO